MRTHEIYEIECLCGKEIVSETKECKCPNCGREIEVRGWGEMEEPK